MDNSESFSTASQRKALYATLYRLGIREKSHQQEIIYDFTEGRTNSSRNLTWTECRDLIQQLHNVSGESPAQRMRKKMIHYAHLMGWKTSNGTADIPRLDSWCKKYGLHKKGLNEMTARELQQVLTQFQNVYKSYLV